MPLTPRNDTVDTLADLRALPTDGLMPTRTFYRVRENNGFYALDGVDARGADTTQGRETSTDPNLMWFRC